MTGAVRAGEVRAQGPSARARTRRLLPWLGVAAVLVVLGLLLAALAGPPQTPLDPGSVQPSGSRALVRVLAREGVAVRATTSRLTALAGDPRAVVVTAPDEYTDAQLRALRDHAARVVLVRPGGRALHALLPGADPRDADHDPDPEPGCPEPGATAGGVLDLPGDAVSYTAAPGTTHCYGGLLLVSGRVAVLGSADALTNDRLGDDGLAALAVNTLTADRTLTAVSWLRPGPDAGGHGAQSLRDLFPAGSFRVLWWLVAVAVLAALWRGRRLGAVVTEALPVVVRSAEAVEGHGRLYLRAGARDRAAAALRAGALRRMRTRLALPASAAPAQVAAVAAALLGRPPADVHRLLEGPPPVDDPALQRLARNLHDVESALAETSTRGSNRAR